MVARYKIQGYKYKTEMEILGESGRANQKWVSMN